MRLSEFCERDKRNNKCFFLQTVDMAMLAGVHDYAELAIIPNFKSN